MSWPDSQRFMRFAAAVRGIGWGISALALLLGTYGVVTSESEEALVIIQCVAVVLTAVIGVSHVAAWFIERHAERVVVR
jgi:hypothetical protein